MMVCEPFSFLLPSDGREALRVHHQGRQHRRRWAGPPGRAAARARVNAELAHANAVAEAFALDASPYQPPSPKVEEFAEPVEEPPPVAEPREVEVLTVDGRLITALLLECPAATRAAPAPVVVLFSAAGMDLEANVEGGAVRPWADWYRSRGVRSITVAVDTAGADELEQYCTAQAAVQYALEELQVPVGQVLVHGVGFGAALASAAALHNPGVACTVDSTFVNATELRDDANGPTGASALHMLPSASVIRRRFEMGSEYESDNTRGKTDPRLAGYVSDLYNNEYKALKIGGEYCVLANTADASLRPDYALRLFEAHYATRDGDPCELRSERLIQYHAHERVSMRGSQCFCEDPIAEARYAGFLFNIGLTEPTWNVPPTMLTGYHTLNSALMISR